MSTSVKAVEVSEVQPIHLVVGASTALGLGVTLTLASLKQVEGVLPFQIGGAVTPIVVWCVLGVITRPRWVNALAGLALAGIFAFLSYSTPANAVFLGLTYLPLIVAVSVGWSRVIRVPSLAVRVLALAALGLFAGISMHFVPYPSGWFLAVAPWIWSQAPTLTLLINRCLGIIYAITLWVAGAFSSASIIGGTIGLVAMIAGIAILRPQEKQAQ